MILFKISDPCSSEHSFAFCGRRMALGRKNANWASKRAVNTAYVTILSFDNFQGAICSVGEQFPVAKRTVLVTIGR